MSGSQTEMGQVGQPGQNDPVVSFKDEAHRTVQWFYLADTCGAKRCVQYAVRLESQDITARKSTIPVLSRNHDPPSGIDGDPGHDRVFRCSELGHRHHDRPALPNDVSTLPSILWRTTTNSGCGVVPAVTIFPSG